MNDDNYYSRTVKNCTEIIRKAFAQAQLEEQERTEKLSKNNKLKRHGITQPKYQGQIKRVSRALHAERAVAFLRQHPGKQFKASDIQQSGVPLLPGNMRVWIWPQMAKHDWITGHNIGRSGVPRYVYGYFPPECDEKPLGEPF